MTYKEGTPTPGTPTASMRAKDSDNLEIKARTAPFAKTLIVRLRLDGPGHDNCLLAFPITAPGDIMTVSIGENDVKPMIPSFDNGQKINVWVAQAYGSYTDINAFTTSDEYDPSRSWVALGQISTPVLDLVPLLIEGEIKLAVDGTAGTVTITADPDTIPDKTQAVIFLDGEPTAITGVKASGKLTVTDNALKATTKPQRVEVAIYGNVDGTAQTLADVISKAPAPIKNRALAILVK